MLDFSKANGLLQNCTNRDPYKVHRFINDIETDANFREDLIHKLIGFKIDDLPKLTPISSKFDRPKLNPDAPLFQCHQCSLPFLSTHTLIAHYSQYHESQYRCFRCNKCFQSNYNFTVHLRKMFCEENKDSATGVRLFRCTYSNCEKVFQSRSDLVDHISLHKMDKKHRCLWRGCEKRFKFKKNLLNHMMISHRDRKYTCSWADCNMSFARLIHLQKHLQDHREQAAMAFPNELLANILSECEAQMQKTECPSPPTQEQKLKLTISGDGQVIKNSNEEFPMAAFKCTWIECDKVFKTKSAFSNHVKSHYGKYTCNWPGCVFGTNSNPIFRRHLACHRRELMHQTSRVDPSFHSFSFESESMNLSSTQNENENSNLEPMVIIDESFGSDTDNKSPLHSDSKRIFQCLYPNCGYITHKRPLFRVHQLKHSDIRKHHCMWPSCGKSFKAKSTLNRHVARHRDSSAGFEPRPFSMNRQFNSSPSMPISLTQPSTSRNNHSEQMNGYHKKSNQEFKCDWPGCNYQTDKLYVILRHKAVHSGLAQFKCPNCSKEFGTSSALSNHMITHNTERPFKCDYPGCRYETFRKSVLERHHLRAHSSEDTLYFCAKPNCKKTFKSWIDLHQHMIAHNVVAKYVCSWPGCGTVFESKSLFSLHIKSHQDEAAKRKSLKSMNQTM